jgi:DNA polymerase III delta prime subunit
MNVSLFDETPNLDEIDFQHDILNRMGKLNVDELNNLIFCGLPTCGKTTKIYALLATIFDKKVYDIKNITYEEDRKVITYKASIYHIEINPIYLGSNEKIFISSFLKLYVETRNIGLNIPKIILIKNADLLSKNSQLALRKIIEQHSYTARFIFEVSNISGFAQTLVSRCLIIRIKMPSLISIKECIKKKYSDISDEIIDNIIFESNKVHQILNLKKIFGFLTYYIHTKKDFKFIYYDKYYDIIGLINTKKISFIVLQKIRDIINELYINLIPMNELLQFIFNKLCEDPKINSFKLLDLTIICDLNLKKGNKDCLHLEHYIISIIDLIQS